MEAFETFEQKEKAKLFEAFKFFREHAGWSEPPGKAVCALSSARVERLRLDAEAEGVASVEWHEEEYWTHDDLGDVDTPEDQQRFFDSGRWTGPFYALLKINGEVVASLGMIVLGSGGVDADPYGRVVAAELVYEVEDEIRQALGDALDAREAMPV